jgi:hypothetical protein
MRQRAISAEHRSSDRDAEEVVKFRWPDLVNLGEFGRTEFNNAREDIWQALIAEGWTGQSRNMLGWDLPDHERAERNDHDPLHERLSGQDKRRSMAELDHAQELDFDR